jgi:hypothetical protein
MTSDSTTDQWRPVADAFTSLRRDLGDLASLDDALPRLTAASLRLLPGAEHAAISRSSARSPYGFETVAATSDLPPRVDRIQYELRSGPCVDAILDKSVFRAGDLRTDPRWPDFGKRAAEETGVLSMLSFRFYFEDNPLIAGINFYATTEAAFTDVDEALGELAATHGALVITAARRQERADNLERALQSNRDIGIAIGVLMSQHKVTREQAFDLLRIASQHTNRKLRDLALDVIDTGVIELPQLSGKGPSR